MTSDRRVIAGEYSSIPGLSFLYQSALRVVWLVPSAVRIPVSVPGRRKRALKKKKPKTLKLYTLRPMTGTFEVLSFACRSRAQELGTCGFHTLSDQEAGVETGHSMVLVYYGMLWDSIY